MNRPSEEKLLKGISNFFGIRFPRQNYKTSPYIDSQGYHMSYRDVEYSINFDLANRKLLLKASMTKKPDDLEQIIEENRISNKQLEKTKYLSNQQITIDKNSIDVSCRLKKIPDSEYEINKFCIQVWGSIVQRIMKSVYNYRSK